MNRNRIRSAAKFASGLIIALIVWEIAVTVTSPTDQPANQTADTATYISGQCTLNDSGYSVTLNNDGTQATEITGFTVLFYDANSNELSSDTEPGNGTVDGIKTVGMSEWIGSGKNLTWNIGISTPSEAATCQIASYSES